VERAAIQWERSIRLRKGGDEGGSGDNVRQERIFSDYAEGSGGCSLSTRFEVIHCTPAVNLQRRNFCETLDVKESYQLDS
jgi:hypothetical protein